MLQSSSYVIWVLKRKSARIWMGWMNKWVWVFHFKCHTSLYLVSKLATFTFLSPFEGFPCVLSPFRQLIEIQPGDEACQGGVVIEGRIQDWNLTPNSTWYILPYMNLSAQSGTLLGFGWMEKWVNEHFTYWLSCEMQISSSGVQQRILGLPPFLGRVAEG